MVRRTIHKDNPADVVALMRRLPVAFDEALLELIKWRGCTVEELAERSLVSDKTIRRLKNNPNSESTLETVIAVCVGLHLPPVLCYELIRKAGFYFKPTLKHVVYQDLLSRAYYDGISMYKLNETLMTQGLDVIGSD